MASKGNSWCKKLLNKERLRVAKLKLGNEKGILARSKGSTFWHAALQLKRQQELLHGLHHGNFHNEGGVIPATLEDELPPEGVVCEIKKVREFTAPKKEGFSPRPFGWRRARRLSSAV